MELPPVIAIPLGISVPLVVFLIVGTVLIYSSLAIVKRRNWCKRKRTKAKDFQKEAKESPMKASPKKSSPTNSPLNSDETDSDNIPRDQFYFSRLLIIRGLGFLYFATFINILIQYEGIWGNTGMFPVSVHMKRLHKEYFPERYQNKKTKQIEKLSVAEMFQTPIKMSNIWYQTAVEKAEVGKETFVQAIDSDNYVSDTGKSIALTMNLGVTLASEIYSQAKIDWRGLKEEVSNTLLLGKEVILTPLFGLVRGAISGDPVMTAKFETAVEQLETVFSADTFNGPYNIFLYGKWLPFTDDLRVRKYLDQPTLLWFANSPFESSKFLEDSLWIGVALSLFVLVVGCSNYFVLLALWAIKLSIVIVGQRFMGYGWHSQLLEFGFLCVFLGDWGIVSNSRKAISWKATWLLKFLLFRVMFECGVGKVMGSDVSWWPNCDALSWHFWTQPSPNTASYYFHGLPKSAHYVMTWANHFVEILLPFVIFIPDVYNLVTSFFCAVSYVLCCGMCRFSSSRKSSSRTPSRKNSKNNQHQAAVASKKAERTRMGTPVKTKDSDLLNQREQNRRGVLEKYNESKMALATVDSSESDTEIVRGSSRDSKPFKARESFMCQAVYVMKYAAGLQFILFQLALLVSGNFSYLGYLTIVQCLVLFDDRFWSGVFSMWISESASKLIEDNYDEIVREKSTETNARKRSSIPVRLMKGSMINTLYMPVRIYKLLCWAVFTGVVLYLTLLAQQPLRSVLTGERGGDVSFNNFHLVNGYGAFSNMTKDRKEILLFGSADGKKYDVEYGWVTKPDSQLNKTPFSIAPFDWFVDWSIWFVPFNSINFHPWVLRLMYKLLKKEKSVEELMVVPKGAEKVKFLRLESWQYEFDYSGGKNWWKRSDREIILEGFSLDHPVVESFAGDGAWKGE